MKPTLRFHFLFLVLFSISQHLHAQIPQVPLEMEFADLTLKIHPQAQREIQLDVDALHRSASYFKLKADRVSLYLPLVERELQKQGVPDEIKYLVIQESGLIPDAVSTSNAVGFWQFKQGTAEEVGLRVDSQVDERKNIVTSTQGAARYLKKHQLVLDNWMTALVSYQMGLGGAKAYFGNQYSGKKVVVVDRNTHWYFKKFLAHKIAYQATRTVFTSNQKRLSEVQIQGPTTFSSLAKQFGVTADHLIEYNKWALNGKIPAGTFTLFYVKSTGNDPGPIVKQQQVEPTKQAGQAPGTSRYKPANAYPKISASPTKNKRRNQLLINDLEGVQATSKTSTYAFSKEIGMREKRFLKLNDFPESEQIEQGAYYYTEKKRPSAEASTHVVEAGETLWSISQKYGIRLAALKSKNRIRKDADLRPGMVLNLKEPRKRGEEIPMYQEPSPTTATLAPTKPIQTTEDKPAPLEVTKLENSASFHTVQAGETLFSISKKYGITVEELKQWNGIGSTNLITVGQKLRILTP